MPPTQPTIGMQDVCQFDSGCHPQNHLTYSLADALSIIAQRAANDVNVDVDLAVVDYRLPAMNGCVLAGFLRARHPGLKIILYSGESDIPEGETSNVDAFVSKGGGIQPLLIQVSELTDFDYESS